MNTNKLKVLFFAANPTRTTPLKLDEEVREITQKIYATEHRDTLDLLTMWAIRPDDLIQYLNQHKPHIVHFSGHGHNSGEIILSDYNGIPKPVSIKAIHALFSTFKDNIRLVILNSCYSKVQAQAITGLIDCVIGMNSKIQDNDAIIFSASFYRAIGFGRSIKDAFDQAKVALLLHGSDGNDIPELLTKDGIDASNIFLLEERKNDNLLQIGINFLEKKSYQQSINTLKDLIKNNPESSDAYYYLSLALLKGRRPKVLKRTEIEEIEQLLCATPTTNSDLDGNIQYFLALIKEDYYFGNRIKCPPPSIQDILTSASRKSININKLRILLLNIPMLDNRLYATLAKKLL